MPAQLPAASAHSAASLRVADARARILSQLQPIAGTQRVPLQVALGRILAEDVLAPHNVPAYDNAAMDGYAVRFDDLADGAPLAVAGRALAGHPFNGVLASGHAIRIMTGAPLPVGADTVIMQEEAHVADDRVTFQAGQRREQHVRRAGEDLAQGQVALARGRRCEAAELGLMASLGLTEVTVRRRLRVAYFSSGDELTPPGAPLASGHIYDSNRFSLYGALTRLGCEAIDLGQVSDTPEALERALREAASHADAIVTSGGVSVGDADFIRTLLTRLGTVDFWKIDMKPGRPMAFGRIDNTWIFGLPGNPVATLVAFQQLVRDALLHLGGLSPLPAPFLLPACSLAAIRKRPGRREFLRGHAALQDGRLTVAVSGAQGAGILKSMSDANCFIVLAEEQGDVAAGESVSVQLFSDFS